jgi:formylglycine-generating enzyme required for sulfatase activity
MSCVGFCDALAFCEWAGKRLCGSTDGGPLPGAEAPTNDKSEWYLACSNGGKTKYPYGDAFEPGRCDSGGKDEPGRPAAESQCAGLGTPFDAIKDLSGGMSEWEDDCVPEGSCRIRGGSAGTQELDTLACTGDMRLTAYLEASTVATVGFRCCADSGPR